MKKWFITACALILVFVLSACGSSGASSGKKGYVGIAMPTKSSERWIKDGNNMKKQFEKMGYKVDLQYAEDDVQNQVSQIENMITKGANVLVIGAIDGEALTDVLKKAHDQKIKVIAYDRLIRNTKYVNYYATFDNYKVGVIQAKYIEDKLGLKQNKGPFNIELFGGSPDDNNSLFFYNGAMSVLNPYIKSGKLKVLSGQTKFNQIATLRWDGATAQSRMDNILSAKYTNAKVDAVLSPYDGISIGVISSLKSVGYGSKDKPMPVITGQDAELASVKSIIKGEQTQTVFKDTRKLAKQTVKMVDQMLNDKKVDVNDTKTYDNGVKVVPSYLLDPVSVDKSNYKKVLVDSGYYKTSELK
ncbi:sugar ABC transporter substrate-binding protein [Weizmannia coagulans]|uniref:Sugar ABC transporter ATP-binding protein n=3 Tax=Heyndrickxia TaxID=2837504 RepID=G2TLS5_HEYCO|nr:MULTISPECIES: multiple monosaccharide ABC transporter substrate-binding protein [Heyndrickxia]AEP01528.1 sugar ABC transporter ATP-binding protein [Heyndrickxia coagulans 36D1]AJO22073.1 sugar ABC transporter ATP-binding protein [Heyndrickxia coagulans]AKN56378.1 L-arabinose-binding periplasmic protein precursor AraF [Heyndrickxia coagulans]ATW82485.1 sugar ABC transporter substrate-binding protein [Heyndrickxia coagulans]AWP37737.1 sugar ABC transporter substrate-binding protein [Heyndrick